MATVLAGFLGAPPRDVPDTPQGYKDAKYQFGGEATPRAAKFFSIALRQYLNDNGRGPQRWLILGTEKSMWDALYQAVPKSERDAPFEQALKDVSAAARQDSVDQGILRKWSDELSRLLKIEVICFLTGNAEDETGQAKVWSAMEQQIGQGDDVIFDITHSLRHFAVISTFSVMLLRELRDIKSVDFYYGALELTTAGISRVIHMPICQQLSNATQAVATHRLTGDFRSLGECLDVSSEFDNNLKTVAYADELNRPKAQLAEQLQEEALQSDNFLAQVLNPKLQTSLDWVSRQGLDIQYGHKAQRAFECGQYFKAIAYLFEALALAQMYYENEKRTDYLHFGRRNKAREELVNVATYEELFNSNQEAELALKTYNQMRFLRNAVLHGTKAVGQPESADVERAIKEEPVLIAILRNGFLLFDKLSSVDVKGRTFVALPTSS